eukprot:TRINITY_DN18127_c0_g1_i2.p1 TRINITY_DN18127_c0_g1~~TRINITY_DN18127_c0_g1_i2.p1  ORF type:complete len:652 (-),score=149.21 TRINITY_DN18127_c0_g1_i2:50-2005(-)
MGDARQLFQEKRRAGVAGVNGISAGFQDDTDRVIEESQAREDIHTLRRKSFQALLHKTARPPPTHDDLDSVVKYFLNKTSEDKSELKIIMSEIVTKLDGEVERLEGLLSQHERDTQDAMNRDAEEARRFTTICASRLEEELDMARITAEEDLKAGLSEAAMEIQAVREAEWADREHIARRVDALAAEVSASTAVKWATTTALVRQQREALLAEIERAMAVVKTDLEQQLHTVQNIAAEKLGDAIVDQANLRAEQDARNERARAAITEQLQGLQAHLGEHSKLIDRGNDRVIAGLEVKLEALRAQTEEGFRVAEDRTQGLCRAVVAVENVPTRCVEWSMHEISACLADCSCNGMSWFSPKFDAAGLRDLQLELKFLGSANRPGVLASNGIAPPATDPGHKTSPLNSRRSSLENDCVISLHSNEPGLRLLCRLFVGSASAIIQHSFDGAQACESGRLCSLQGQLKASQEDVLRAGVEVLEVVRSLDDAQRSPLERGMEPENDSPERTPEGVLSTQRYLLNRTLEEVQKEEQRLTAHVQNTREYKAEVAQTFQRHSAKVEANASACATQHSRIDATLATKLDIEAFEKRWEKVISGEVKVEIGKQQEQLCVALDKEDQLIALTEAMQKNLKTALALKGRGPPRLPLVMSRRPGA